MFVAVCNMVGSFAGGWLVDRLSQSKLLTGLPLMSAIALSVLSIVDSGFATLLCLGLVGLVYGAIIAAYPAVVAKLFGMTDGPRVYGRVFTAWGTAGLIAPWFAGYLFDYTGGYGVAITAAAAMSCASAVFAFVLFGSGRPKTVI